MWCRKFAVAFVVAMVLAASGSAILVASMIGEHCLLRWRHVGVCTLAHVNPSPLCTDVRQEQLRAAVRTNEQQERFYDALALVEVGVYL